ncbi:MAG: hypothetical protein KAW12_25960 [Candidatus Aminicenantes bacterium]|nr:hypothetical protein [Candidatus Aminicenantes bacterium]
MVTIQEIKGAIESLPKGDYLRIRNWLFEKDCRLWEEEIKEDSANGRLDFLVEEALQAKKAGALKEL